VLHSHPNRGQTRPLLAENVLWWERVDILWVQDAAFQMLLPQLLRCRRRCLHQFLHSLVHSEVDTAPVKVLVVVVASVDAVDAVDEVDAGDEADAVDEADEADAGDGVDEVDAADVAGVALALYAAERIVRTHHILAAAQAAARFEDNAFRGCQTLP
jgi:hypothetical protein